MKKIFVTGASGFVGKSLVKKLSKKYKVIALVRNSQSIKEIKNLGASEIVVGDIRKPNKFSKLLNTCDTLVHLAALRSNWMPENEFYKINSDSLIGLLKECKKVKHVIVTSSTYVHGFENTLNVNEDAIYNAKDLYGKSKVKAEQITKEVLQKTHTPYTIIRPTVVYGPGDNESGMVMKLIKLIKSDKFFVLDNGKNKIQLIYIDDLVQGYEKAIEKSGKNETYILASSKKITMLDFAKLIQSQLGLVKKIKSIPKLPLLLMSFPFEWFFKFGLKVAPSVFSKEPPLLPAKVRVLGNNWTYNVLKAQKELDFISKIDYKTGIKKTVQYYR